MTRKEIFYKLDSPQLRAAYLLGAFLYDEATDRGAKLLTVEAVEELTADEQDALNVFVLEQVAAEQGELPQELMAAMQSISEILSRRIELMPSIGGKDCPANGEHEGVECQCDECDFALICFPPEQMDERLRRVVHG